MTQVVEADSRDVWAVATVNVAVFGLLLALGGYLNDGLAEVGALLSLLAFGYLWALTVYMTRWTLREGGFDRVREGDLGGLVFRGALAGGVVGGGFVVGVALVGVLATLVLGFPSPLVFVVIGLIGGLSAAIAGLAVGAGFVLLDVALYRVVDVVVPRDFGEP